MWFFTAFISLFYIAGFSILGYSFFSLRRSLAAATWPTAQGKIVRADLKSSSGSDSTTYQVEVEYEYRVGSRDYTNDVLAAGYAGSGGRDSHEQILDKLQSSNAVDVRYNPSQPEDAVLSFGFHRSLQFMFAFSITWLLFTIGFTIIWWVASRESTVLLDNLTVH
ncbi:DUF3592 domain-containing protein [Stieleria sp. JC731]|nr:DUF3592 domain-containing protein [Stieleria sp. JC731]